MVRKSRKRALRGRPPLSAADPLVPIVGANLKGALEVATLPVKRLAAELEQAGVSVSYQVLQRIVDGDQRSSRQSIRDGIAERLGGGFTSGWLGGDDAAPPPPVPLPVRHEAAWLDYSSYVRGFGLPEDTSAALLALPFDPLLADNEFTRRWADEGQAPLPPGVRRGLGRKSRKPTPEDDRGDEVLSHVFRGECQKWRDLLALWWRRAGHDEFAEAVRRWLVATSRIEAD